MTETTITPQHSIAPPAEGYRRWKVVVEYHGGGYSGWQRQDNVPTIQGEIENAIFQFSGETVTLQCAGRTDAGVHATHQVAHFDLKRDITPFRLRAAINNFLRRKGISIIDAEIADNNFHARYCAKERAYIYRILPRRAHPTFTWGTVWHVHQELNVDAMHHAAQVLVGTHDFSSFRAAECQANSPIKTIDYITIKRPDSTNDILTPMANEIHMHIGARSFLHHQVRNIIGTLYQVGVGRWTDNDVKHILEACDRSAAGKTAPPDGLYLTHVGY